MKKQELTKENLIGYIKCQMVFEQTQLDFYKEAMENREEGTPEYESFKGEYYGHLHTHNVLYDILKLLEN